MERDRQCISEFIESHLVFVGEHGAQMGQMFGKGCHLGAKGAVGIVVRSDMARSFPAGKYYIHNSTLQSRFQVIIQRVEVGEDGEVIHVHILDLR